MPDSGEFDVVTGAFGYTGRYITRRLLAMGRRVKTLTGHPDRPNPFGEQVSVARLYFDKRAQLTQALRGATTFYNTYWVRFERGPVTFQRAVENTRALLGACEEAGVRRIVHVSITNASEDSPLPYFRGKGVLETAIRNSRLSYAILRPTEIFGPEGILINNVAWLLRRFPLFAVPGAGDYRLQPVFVDDVAELAVTTGQRTDNIVLDAVGPEIYTFDEHLRLVARAVRSRARFVHVPPGMALFLAGVVGRLVGDVLLTREEIEGLMASLLVSRHPPTGQTRLSEWLAANANTVGLAYASELARHYR